MRLVVDYNPQSVSVEIRGRPMTIGIGKSVVKEYTDERPYYDGDYVVEPSAHGDVVLQTKNKVMRDDVTVKKIYYAEVSNIKDGMTAYIAEPE